MGSLLKTFTQNRSLGLALMAAAVFIAYSFMLQAPFRSMDDTTVIVDNPDIRSFANAPKIFTSSFFGDRSYFRPLVTFSYMVEYHWFGLKSVYYNFDNVILHILNALLVYFLMMRFFRDRSMALAVSFLFGIHPIQWEAVSNVSGRVIVLNTLFLLMAFISYIDFRRNRKAVCLAGSIVSFFLALLCKESAAMFPVVLLAYLALMPEPDRDRPKPWMSLAPYFLLVFGMILLRRQLGITELFGWGSVNGILLGFMSFARGVITYLRLFILPTDLYFDRSRMVFQSFGDPELGLTAVFWLLSLFALWKWRAKVSPVILFFMTWFALELAPVSQIVTSLGVQPGFISLAEHFLYVPSIGIFAILVCGWRRLGELNASRGWFSPALSSVIVVVVMAFFLLTSIQQNLYAGNEMLMLRRSLLHQPINSRVLYSMGMCYVKLGKYPEAEFHFARAVMADPWNVRARIALGKSLCDQGRLQEGIAVYESITDAGNLQSLLNENLQLSYMNYWRQHNMAPMVYE